MSSNNNESECNSFIQMLINEMQQITLVEHACKKEQVSIKVTGIDLPTEWHETIEEHRVLHDDLLKNYKIEWNQERKIRFFIEF